LKISQESDDVNIFDVIRIKSKISPHLVMPVRGRTCRLCDRVIKHSKVFNMHNYNLCADCVRVLNSMLNEQD